MTTAPTITGIRRFLPPVLWQRNGADATSAPTAQTPAVRSASLQETFERFFRQNNVNASDELLAEWFAASVVAYRCMEYRANTLSAFGLKVTDRGDIDQVIHPLVNFVDNGRRLLWLISISRRLWGVAYLRKWRNRNLNAMTGKGYASELEWLNNTDVRPEIDYSNDTVTGYWYGLGRQEWIPLEDMVVIAGFDPKSQTSSISAFEVALRHITTERNIINYAGGYFLRATKLSAIVQVDDDVPGGDYTQKVARHIQQTMRGAANAHKTLVVSSTGGVAWNSVQDNLENLAMVELDDQITKKICAAFGVDPALVGLAYVSDALSSGGTYDNIERNHYRTTSLTELNMVLEAINTQWAWADFDPANHYTLRPDISTVEALSNLTQDRAQLALNLQQADTLTRSEARQYIGYEPADEDSIAFERDVVKPLQVLTSGGMSLNEFRAFMGWDAWGENGNVVQVNGVWQPVTRLAEIANANADAPPPVPGGGGLPFGLSMTTPEDKLALAAEIDKLAAPLQLSAPPGIAITVTDGNGHSRTVLTSAQEGEVVDTPEYSQRKELGNWQHKVNRRGPGVVFEPDALLDTDVYEWVRAQLDAGADSDVTFEMARQWLLTGQRPQEEAVTRAEPVAETDPAQEPEDAALLEEFAAYWRRFDELQADIGQDWLAWMGRIGEKAVGFIEANPRTEIDYGALLEADEILIDAWVGTLEEPGPMTALLAAGMAAGNEALERQITINPDNARARPDILISFDVLFQEAIDYARTYSFDKITGINETTARKLQELVAAWLESGESLDVLRTQLVEVFGDEIRAAQIAQTESTAVYNEGAFRRYESAGVELATVHTVRDGHVCYICRGIALLEPMPFRGGWIHPGGPGELAKYKGQRFERPPFHVGCRCFSRPYLGAVS